MITVEKMRADFEKIWKKNLQQLTLIRHSALEAGDYFFEDETDTITEVVVDANIQPVSDYELQQMEFGLMKKAQYSVYVKHDVDVEAYDYVEWNGVKYKIVNLSIATFNGEVVFKKFNLQRIEDE